MTSLPSIFRKGSLFALAFFVALTGAVAFQVAMNSPKALAGSDTYPAPWAPPTAQDTIFDTWRELNRECTSYVSWMLHSVNGYEMPFYDDAANWGPDAQARGIVLNMTPAVGSVYWTKAPGHVAYVESVNLNAGTITTEDYNSGYPTNPGYWAEHPGVAISSASGYIHFKDATLPPSVPTYDLRQFYVSNGSWYNADISSATGVQIIGNPAPSSSGTWATDTNGRLRQFYVSNGAWTAYDVSSAIGSIGVAGNPATSSSGTWARGNTGNFTNHLLQIYVSNGAWTYADVSGATGVNISGNPVPVTGGVYARGTNGHLYVFYVANGSWTAFDVSTATGTSSMSGDPAIGSVIWVRGGSGNFTNHMLQLFVSNGAWTYADISGATGVNINSNPVVDPNGGEWAQDANQQLQQFYVSNGSWTHANVSGAIGINVGGNPAVGNGATWARGATGNFNNHLLQLYVSNGAWTYADVSGATGQPISLDPIVDPSGIMWAAS